MKTYADNPKFQCVICVYLALIQEKIPYYHLVIVNPLFHIVKSVLLFL